MYRVPVTEGVGLFDALTDARAVGGQGGRECLAMGSLLRQRQRVGFQPRACSRHLDRALRRPPPPQRLQTGGPEAHAPGKPLTLYRTPFSAACPDRVKPRHALLRAACAGRRSVLGAPLAPRAKRRSEKVALYFLSVSPIVISFGPH